LPYREGTEKHPNFHPKISRREEGHKFASASLLFIGNILSLSYSIS